MLFADEVQRQYFAQAKFLYPRHAVIAPPLHTVQEMEGVLGALAGVSLDRPVLDFGAGTGRLTIPLARRGFAVVAVDTSAQSLAILSGIASELGISGIRTSDSLPIDEAFAAVTGADVLHHVNLDDILPRLRALLDVGGRIVFTEPGGLNPAWYVWFGVHGQLRAERRIVTCNIRTLSTALRRHRFHDVRITGVGLLPRSLFDWSAAACRVNDRCGSLPVLRWFAYRYRIEAAA